MLFRIIYEDDNYVQLIRTDFFEIVLIDCDFDSDKVYWSLSIQIPNTIHHKEF